MFKAVQYFGRFQQFQGSFSSLPGWARLIVFVFALPALAIAALAIVLLGVSITALLLLTVPVYRALSAVTGQRQRRSEPGWVEARSEIVVDSTGAQSMAAEQATSGRRQIEVKIIE